MGGRRLNTFSKNAGRGWEKKSKRIKSEEKVK